MKLTVINHMYSQIGPFAFPVEKFRAELNRMFGGFQSSEAQEKLPNGEVAKIYTFVKANRLIRFRTNRIDIEMAFGPYSSVEEFKEFVIEASTKIAKISSVKGNRIAFTATAFIPNNENEVVNDCETIFNIEKTFDTSIEEFSLRINSIEEVRGEKVNNVFKCNDGMVTNNSTKERQKCMFLTNDVNTVISQSESRFAIDDAAFYLDDLISIAEKTNDKFIRKIEEA